MLTITYRKMFEEEVQMYFMNEHCTMNKRKFREEF